MTSLFNVDLAAKRSFVTDTEGYLSLFKVALIPFENLTCLHLLLG